MKKNPLKSNAVQSLIASLVCILLGLFIGYLVLLIINPAGAGKAIGDIVKNFLTYNKPASQLKYFGNTLVKTAPLLMCALAILFAYVVNSKYVFQDKCETLKDHVQPFCKFVSARLVTMVIEVGGVWLLVSVMGLNDMIGKFLTQFIVLILNYVFSKFFVFTTGKKNAE
mgnify:CR=1 FL=1